MFTCNKILIERTIARYTIGNLLRYSNFIALDLNEHLHEIAGKIFYTTNIKTFPICDWIPQVANSQCQVLTITWQKQQVLTVSSPYSQAGTLFHVQGKSRSNFLLCKVSCSTQRKTWSHHKKPGTCRYTSK